MHNMFPELWETKRSGRPRPINPRHASAVATTARASPVDALAKAARGKLLREIWRQIRKLILVDARPIPAIPRETTRNLQVRRRRHCPGGAKRNRRRTTWIRLRFRAQRAVWQLPPCTTGRARDCQKESTRIYDDRLARHGKFPPGHLHHWARAV